MILQQCAVTFAALPVRLWPYIVSMRTLTVAAVARGHHGVRCCCTTKISALQSPAAPAASAAGGGHAIVYHPDFAIQPLPDAHRFPMPKDELLYRELVRQGLANRTFTPTYPDADTLALVHSREYVDAFLDGSISAPAMRRIGLPWSEPLVRRTLIGTGSAVLAVRLALQYGVACMTNGGTHHAHIGYGSGWCIFNDLAVAVRAAQRDAGLGRALFVDLDVHQGDGTAAIFADDPSVFTFSMHCAAQGFPSRLQHSDLDVALPGGTSDEQYLQTLAEALPALLLRERPELVLYNAGVDVSAHDDLGKLALTDDGIARRDCFVLQSCADAGVPVACAIGGGYCADHSKLVDRHMLLHRAAAELLPQLQRCGQAARRQLRSSASLANAT